MKKEIVDRIEKRVGVTNLAEILAKELSGSDLHSLMLAIIKNRLEQSDLPSLKLLQPKTLSGACNIDARLLNKFDQLAYETAPDFEAVELSLLVPLGTISKLTGLDQGNVLSTIRAMECASDPTVGLALEAALKRKSTREKMEGPT